MDRTALCGAMNRVGILLLAIVSLVGFWGCSKYPFTAQQAGKTSLGLQGRNIAVALRTFHEMHARWPQTLSELVHSGLITSEDLLYPRTCDLVDRRDLLKITERVEWIYLRPRDIAPDLPLLIAPLPYTSSMGRRLQEPERIVVRRDATVEWRKEHEITNVIRTLAGT